MRIRKGSIRGRVKSDLPIVFTQEKLTAYGGLEIMRRFLNRSGFSDRLQAVFSLRQFDGDYGSFRITLALIGMLLVGGSRIRHLSHLERDPVFLRFARLQRLPTDRTVSNTLKETTSAVREELNGLLREVAYDTVREARLSRLTMEFDGTVLRAGLCVDGAARGFNPHHPKDKSYYPLTAHLAQTGQLLAVHNREGNVHDSRGALELLSFLASDIREKLGPRRLEARFDGAFFRREILEFLRASGIEYAIRAPLWDWLGIRPEIEKRRRWKRIRPGIQAFSTKLLIPKWKMRLRVVIYRKQVSHRTRKNFQLDLYDPNDGHYEYSAFATNKKEGLGTLWEFMAGRGGHEKTLCELKQHLAFDTIPTNDWDANSTWQLISALTHNVVRQFQITMGAVERANGRKRTYRWVLESLRTLRYELLNLPARLARPEGRAQLRIAASLNTQRRIETLLEGLREAA
ncbi:MAG: IS1380 family transposase [Deltaproteobacteria bacterium]|nr:IS1380 family transposase [Deltaproteobacteria bacterium]